MPNAITTGAARYAWKKVIALLGPPTGQTALAHLDELGARMRIREFLHIELENEDEDVEEEPNPRSCYSKGCTERELVDGMSLDHPSLAEADATLAFSHDSYDAARVTH
jgi:hypothetical protein